MDGMVTAGRVGGLFGNKGELTLILYDLFPRDPNMEEPLFVEIDGHAVPLFLESFVRRGVKGATAVFADIDTVGRASELIGRTFCIRADESADATAYEDVVGWEAWLDTGQKGRITNYFEGEFNSLFEAEIEGEVILIPVVDEFISAIDEEKKRIVFSLPEGLLDLNK
jgi:ribosomal 30S subunit maturation factor RimM